MLSAPEKPLTLSLPLHFILYSVSLSCAYTVVIGVVATISASIATATQVKTQRMIGGEQQYYNNQK